MPTTDITPQRIWAEVDLDSIIFNYQQARACTGGREQFCVIKANAYGHGAVPVARALAGAGATRFAVSTTEEALQLRRHGIKQPILLLGMVDGSWVKPLAKQDIALTVGNMPTARAYAAAGAGPLNIHVKVETGMARTGLPYESAVEDTLAIAAMPNLRIEGIFTHFSSADMRQEDEFTRLQMERFNAVAEELHRRGLAIPLRHCANSAGIVGHPYTHADMTRPGIMLYGSPPIPGHPLELKHTLALRARIVQVQTVARGESVGYGRSWYAPHDTRVATLSIGYADGLQRILSNQQHMLVKGREARICGRVCMDMTMVDVTDIHGVETGDVATIIGADGEARITVDQVAATARTISHEVFCAVGLRVPRFYYQGGNLVGEDSYLQKV